MTRIDPAELARLVEKIAELLPKTTRGPWAVESFGPDAKRLGAYVYSKHLGAVCSCPRGSGAFSGHETNMDLIALAPTMAAAITTLVENTRLEYEGGLAAVARAERAEARLREIEQYAAPSMEPFKDWETEGVNRGKRLLHIHALALAKP